MPTGVKDEPSSFDFLTTQADIAIGGNNEIGNLKIMSLPYHFHYSGYVYDGGTLSENTNGYWWAASAHSEQDARLLGVYPNFVDPVYSRNRSYGFSLRCIITPTS